VVAIRAVESLRAAMLPYARSAREREREIPESVSGFTRLEPEPEPESKVEPEPPTRPERPSDPLVPPASSTPDRRPMSLSLWVGPNFTSDPDASATSMGAQAGIYLGKHWYFAGASLRSSISPTAIRSPAGRAEIQRLSALGQLRGKLDVGDNSAVALQLGGGLIYYSVDGEAEQGFEGRSTSHHSPVFNAEFLAAQWFFEQFGAYLSIDGSFASDAPSIRLGEEAVAKLQQPSISGSIGVVIGRR